MGRQRLDLAHDLVDSMNAISAQMKTSKRRITAAVKASGTSLTDIVGLGPITAALIIGHTGNIERFASRHHYASYNGTAPIEASSGDKVRHRLNPRGDPSDQPGQHTSRPSQVHPLRAGLGDKLLRDLAEIRRELATRRRQT